MERLYGIMKVLTIVVDGCVPQGGMMIMFLCVYNYNNNIIIIIRIASTCPDVGEGEIHYLLAKSSCIFIFFCFMANSNSAATDHETLGYFCFVV